MINKSAILQNIFQNNLNQIHYIIYTVMSNKDCDSNVIVKKRGRKSKKEIEEQAKLLAANNASKENINIIFEDKDSNLSITDDLINPNNLINVDDDDNVNDIEESNVTDDNVVKPVGKKRGRKPKGGKIIQQVMSINNNIDTKPNVILHLKCSLKDLNTSNLTPEINSYNYQPIEIKSNNFQPIEAQSYNFQNSKSLSYVVINSVETELYNNLPIKNSNTHTHVSDDNANGNISANNNNNIINKINNDTDIRDVWKKLKTLEHNLHINNICDKKSACFWCTYDFDNPPIYIPKHYIKDSYHVYGCFCSPECATAFLMEENIDSSAKFERYHHINHIYSKIYDYKKNVKPAPNPYYMLEKYYGNLSIQEYRALLKNERLFLIVDKPLTRILPELHEDNDDFIINNKIIPSNTYQLKKNLQKKQTKNNILSEKFGLT
jgi:hypothetical protein